MLFPFLCLSKEKDKKKRHPVKSHFPRSLRIFREAQNSRAFGSLKHAALLFRKPIAHSGLFKGVIVTHIIFRIFFQPNFIMKNPHEESPDEQGISRNGISYSDGIGVFEIPGK